MFLTVTIVCVRARLAITVYIVLIARSKPLYPPMKNNETVNFLCWLCVLGAWAVATIGVLHETITIFALFRFVLLFSMSCAIIINDYS